MASRRPLSSLALRLEAAALHSTRSSPQLPRVLPRPSPRLPQSCPRNPQRPSSRLFSTSSPHRESSQNAPTTNKTSSSRPSSSAAGETKKYSFAEMATLSSSSPPPQPHRIIIDVREPAELQATGRIPGAVNLPLTSAPDFMFLPAEEFEQRFGFARPGDKDEVIFYCKAGVRSRAAARLAGQAGFGGKQGEYPGSWVEWEGMGGKAEK